MKNFLKTLFLSFMIMWAIHLVVISLVSFLHLILQHSIRTIGDWVVDRGWELIIITKLIFFGIVYSFVKIRTHKFELLKSYFDNGRQKARRELVVIILFSYLVILSFGNVAINYQSLFVFWRMLLSVIGLFIFFGIDFLLYETLNVIYPTQYNFEKYLRPLLYSFMFWWFSNKTFQYEMNVSSSLFYLFFILLFLARFRRPNWSYPFYYFSFIILPYFIICGRDLVWGESFSLVKLTHQLGPLEIFTLIFVSINYLIWEEYKNPEYIYRF